MNRRELFFGGLAVSIIPPGVCFSAPPIVADDLEAGWPCPEVGKWWLSRDKFEGFTFHASSGVAMHFVGAVVVNGEVLSRGRVYTSDEWARVSSEVNAWLDARESRVAVALERGRQAYYEMEFGDARTTFYITPPDREYSERDYEAAFAPLKGRT